MVDNYALQPCIKASRAPALALRRTGLSRRAGSRPESGVPQLMHLASNSNNELIDMAEFTKGPALSGEQNLVPSPYVSPIVAAALSRISEAQVKGRDGIVEQKGRVRV
ncbi:hypothetical protein [Mesorhizobium sp. M1143]|uniref:hypothetical protein n=1 Tax=Mesorhizobium sp. M1143 TaxID=2957061 RepID=UPI00333B911D